MSRPSRRGSIPIEPLIFVVWLAIAAAMVIPLILWARELAEAESMGFGPSFWVEVKRHWFRSGLGAVFLLLAGWSVITGGAFNFGGSDPVDETEPTVDPEPVPDAPPAHDTEA